MKALVVGAGVAGAACAARLARADVAVTVVDKGRGPGGRCSTRRIEGHTFDHGAQFFTARDPVFQEAVDAWVEAGAVATWDAPLVRVGPDGAIEPARAATRYVGKPTMSSLLRHLQRDLEVRFSARVTAVTRYSNGWRAELGDGGEVGAFDLVLIAIPAPQAVPLLRAAPTLAEAAGSAAMAPCDALVVAFAEAFDPGWSGAFVEDGGPLAWVAHDASKPGRTAGPRWIVHAGPDWSRAHRDDSPDQVREALLAALAERFGPLPPVSVAQVHRWSLARPLNPVGQDALFDRPRSLGACGDWCRGDRIEDAFSSGVALADAVLAQRK